MKNILIVNDDGIASVGLAMLARHAAGFGRVFIVAPEHQCSGMSESIIFDRPLKLKRADLNDMTLSGIDNIREAYSLDGTPADCVRYGVGCVLKEKPDIVLSGINNGYNTGVDILYSGTVGAAMQALVYGIPAIAVSIGRGAVDFSVIEENIDELLDRLMKMDIGADEIWNVNFPKCSAGELKGILFDRKPDSREFTAQVEFRCTEEEDGSMSVFAEGVEIGDADHGSDKRALRERYISVGRLRSMVTQKRTGDEA